MSIVVVTAPATTNLTMVETIKATLGLCDNTYDDLLEDMIKGASAFVGNYCNRIFPRQTVTESLAGKGLPNLLLTITPIISIAEVAYDGTALDVSEYEILDDQAGIIQRANGFTSTNFPFTTMDNAPSPYYKNKWSVTYTGGYLLPEDEGRTLPYDLERAVVEIVKTQFSTRQIDGTIKRYKIGETLVDWDRTSNNGFMPKSAETVLSYYRRAI